MLLAIDMGNTQTAMGLFDGDELVQSWRMPTDRSYTADEIHVRLMGRRNQAAGGAPPGRWCRPHRQRRRCRDLLWRAGDRGGLWHRDQYRRHR